MSTRFQAKAKLSWSGAEALAPVDKKEEREGERKQWSVYYTKTTHAITLPSIPLFWKADSVVQ